MGARSRLVLGTAQLGLRYGITNSTVLLPEGKLSLLQAAADGGVECLDTARAYGDSEEVVGAFLNAGHARECAVVTKLSPLGDLSTDASPTEVRAAVNQSLHQSHKALGLVQLDTVLLHRASHLTEWNGGAWQALRDAMDRGQVSHIGVSVQSPAEVMQALAIADVSHIQLPFNILDWRWDSVLSELRDARRRRRLVVHVRSLLLQGLLTTDRADAWARAGVTDAGPVRRWLKDQVKRLGLESVTHLCLAYAHGQDWIDGLVVGMDNIEQLLSNLQLLARPGLDPAELLLLAKTRPFLRAESLNPATWTNET